MIQNTPGKRIEGPTPNGGAYAEMYEGENFIEIVEFNDQGDAIFRTYFEPIEGNE